VEPWFHPLFGVGPLSATPKGGIFFSPHFGETPPLQGRWLCTPPAAQPAQRSRAGHCRTRSKIRLMAPLHEMHTIAVDSAANRAGSPSRGFQQRQEGQSSSRQGLLQQALIGGAGRRARTRGRPDRASPPITGREPDHRTGAWGLGLAQQLLAGQ